MGQTGGRRGSLKRHSSRVPSYQLLHGNVALLRCCDDKSLHRAQYVGHEVVEVDVNNWHIVSLRGECHLASAGELIAAVQ